MASVKLFDKYGNEIDHLTQWDMNVTLKITEQLNIVETY